MSIKSAVKAFFAGRSIGEQLAQAETALSDTEADLVRLRGQRPDLVRRKMLGDDAATSRLVQLDAEIVTAEIRQRDLRDAVQATRAEIMQEQAAAQRRENVARPRRIAELVSEHRKLADEISAALAAAAERLRAMPKNSAELAALLDDRRTNGWFSLAAFRTRAQSAAAAAFAINRHEPLTTTNSLLGLQANFTGPGAYRTLGDLEQIGLDDIAPFFLTIEDADAARARLKARGAQTMILSLHSDVWMLIPGERIFGRRDLAEKAASREKGLRVIAGAGGWIVVDERFIGKAE